MKVKKMKVVYVSSYPPRECGIATFTEDLIKAIDEYKILAPGVVVAINESGAKYDYDNRVKFQIKRDSLESYLESASWINDSDIDIVNLQHEFGLFGGDEGEYIISFLEKLQKPFVTTLHKIPYLNSKKGQLVEKVAGLSDSIVVIGSHAAHILKEEYKIRDNIYVIPHGCPYIPNINREKVKASLGLENKIIMSTFGLINSTKGIEYVVNAMPSIVKQDSRATYMIIGETHPEIRKTNGEQYRNMLIALVANHGLKEHVIFKDYFLTKEELIKYLQATDIYISPYVTKNQVSSGALAYAFAAGKAIISTPFPHAQELLSNNRGLFCKFENADSIAECAITLLKDNKLRETIEKKARNYSRQFLWSKVAKKYIELFQEIARKRSIIYTKNFYTY